MSSSTQKLLFLFIFIYQTNGGILDALFGNDDGGGGGHVQQRGRHHQARTNDARMEFRIPLKELYLGSQRQISYNRNVICKHCGGTGAKGGQTKRCPKCKGKGQIIENVQVMPGFHMQQQRTCPRCNGKGVVFKHKCPHCNGQGVHMERTTIDIEIEKGMSDNQEIRFRGKSEEAPGHITGDLIAVIKQENHPYFEREGDNLRTAVDLSLKQALLGFDLNIEHMDGEVVHLDHVNEITQHHQVRTYENKGMPIYKRPRRYGDLFIEYRVDMPKVVTSKQRKELIDLFPDLSLEGEYGK